MKIVIIQGAFLPVPPIQGGAVEKIWYKMGVEFAAVNNSVVHISKKVPELPVKEEKNGVQYIRVKGYETPASLLKLKLLDLIYTIRAIRKIPRDADVIVTNTFWAPLLLRGKTGRKLYVDVQRVPKGQMKYYLHVGILRACSPAIGDAIIREIPSSERAKVSYIPNPVPFEVKQLNGSKRNIILFVGRLHPEKGVHVLIEAFKKITSEKFADWRLLVVGPHESKDGGGGEDYFKELKMLANSEQIQFTGPVFKDSELSQYFSEAAVFCYPAQDGSGDAAPVAPREAMAYGAVTVVSQLPCFNDLIFDKKNGVTFNQSAADQVTALANALLPLMENYQYRHALSERGRQTVDQFAPVAVAKQFLQDFKKITG